MWIRGGGGLDMRHTWIPKMDFPHFDGSALCMLYYQEGCEE
jgi:hypothetical protein